MIEFRADLHDCNRGGMEIATQARITKALADAALCYTAVYAFLRDDGLWDWETPGMTRHPHHLLVLLRRVRGWHGGES